jgi:hypothetical protein
VEKLYNIKKLTPSFGGGRGRKAKSTKKHINVFFTYLSPLPYPPP